MRPVCDAEHPWLTVRHAVGGEAVQQILAAMIEGRTDPREGWMLQV